jgi:acetyl esterase/lipase
MTYLASMLAALAAAAQPPAPLEIPLLGAAADRSALFVYLPERARRNGTAVVICPGGAYMRLVMDTEGHDTARWLVDNGVAGIVLRYRLPAGKEGRSHDVPLADAHEAMRVVRKHAAEWGIDPRRIGIMGYSAGGHVASTAGTHHDAETRPDFMVLMYPVVTMGEFAHPGSRNNLLGPKPDATLVKLYSNELHVTADTPPTFLAHAGDDRPVSVRNSVDFYLALLRAGVPAEMHVYERGDHGLRGGKGGGIGGDPSTSYGKWPVQVIDWMRQRGLLR